MLLPPEARNLDGLDATVRAILIGIARHDPTMATTILSHVRSFKVSPYSGFDPAVADLVTRQVGVYVTLLETELQARKPDP